MPCYQNRVTFLFNFFTPSNSAVCSQQLGRTWTACQFDTLCLALIVKTCLASEARNLAAWRKTGSHDWSTTAVLRFSTLRSPSKRYAFTYVSAIQQEIVARSRKGVTVPCTARVALTKIRVRTERVQVNQIPSSDVRYKKCEFHQIIMHQKM